MVINEVVDYAKKSGKDCLIFKGDFEKAYESVNWNFLDYMLVRIGFNDKQRSRIRICIFFGKLSTLVNGIPTVEVNI